jgi:hypothetical protein
LIFGLVVALVGLVVGGLAALSGAGIGSTLVPLLALHVDFKVAVAAAAVSHSWTAPCGRSSFEEQSTGPCSSASAWCVPRPAWSAHFSTPGSRARSSHTHSQRS